MMVIMIIFDENVNDFDEILTQKIPVVNIENANQLRNLPRSEDIGVALTFKS